MKSSNVGDIVSIQNVDNSKIKYSEDSLRKINYYLYPIGGGAGVPSFSQ